MPFLFLNLFLLFAVDTRPLWWREPERPAVKGRSK